MTDITLTDHPAADGGRLTASVDGHELLIRYGWTDEGVMRVDFVGIPPALGGRGLGTQLVGALVEHARARSLSIVPVCSFARTQLDRHPEWHDVLA